MEEKTWYEVHMHAFNLGHPSFIPFIRRALREVVCSCLKPRRVPYILVVVAVVIVLLPPFIIFLLVSTIPAVHRRVRFVREWLIDYVKRKLVTPLNLLSVLENDIGSTFLLMENCLRENDQLLQRDGLHVGGKTYTRLRKQFDRLVGSDRVNVGSRILFGSDFAVNLAQVRSYNQYVDLFSQTEALTSEEKHAFCSANPQRFLFSRTEQ